MARGKDILRIFGAIGGFSVLAGCSVLLASPIIDDFTWENVVNPQEALLNKNSISLCELGVGNSIDQFTGWIKPTTKEDLKMNGLVYGGPSNENANYFLYSHSGLFDDENVFGLVAQNSDVLTVTEKSDLILPVNVQDVLVARNVKDRVNINSYRFNCHLRAASVMIR